MRAFYSWLEEHNDHSEEKCPSEVLCMKDKALLCHWLCICVKEARRKNGEEYTAKSVLILLSGLQRFINLKQEPHEPLVKLADPTNPAFKELPNVAERHYQELHEKGIDATWKQAEIVSKEEEQGLWESSILGAHSPLAPLNSMLFYNGLYFVLRGGEERRKFENFPVDIQGSRQS